MHAEDGGGSEAEDDITPDVKLRNVKWTVFGADLCVSCNKRKVGQCQPRKKVSEEFQNRKIETRPSKIGYGPFVGEFVVICPASL